MMDSTVTDFDTLNPPKSDTDIPPVPALKPADTLISNRINAIPLDPGMMPDNEVPGLLPEMRRVMGRLHPDDWRSQEGAVKQLRAEYNAIYQAQQQQHRLQTQQRQEYYGKIDNEYTTRLAPSNPKQPTVDEVLTDPRLKEGGKEAADLKQKLMGIIGRQGKIDPAAAVDATNKHDIFSRIIQDYGTPGKITSEKDIDQAYNKEQITWPSYQALIHKYRDMQTVEGEKLAAAEKRLYADVAGAIWGPTNIDKEMRDRDSANAVRENRESADQRLSRYRSDLYKKIEEYKDQNKDPSSLLISGTPDYFGKPEIVKNYTPTPKEKNKPQPPPAIIQKMPSEMSDEELRAFGRIDANRAAAEAEAIRRYPNLKPTSQGAPLGR